MPKVVGSVIEKIEYMDLTARIIRNPDGEVRVAEMSYPELTGEYSQVEYLENYMTFCAYVRSALLAHESAEEED